MSQKNNKFNYATLGLILSAIGTIAAVLAIPSGVYCSIGLFADSCPSLKEIDLITQTETGESLGGVKVQFIAKGAPEVQYTDSNGYVKVKIASRGDVRINLSKSGQYTGQDFIINLANDQNTVRIIRLTKSGQPDVSSLPTIPNLPVTTPSPAIASTQPSKEISWNETASSLIGNVDQDFNYICPANGTVGTVYGTDFYTINSSICSSAVHAGIITARTGGKVQIRIRPGENFYNGMTRNGVTSNRAGSSKGSFSFLNSLGLPMSPTVQIQLIEWNESASGLGLNGKLDQDFTYMCSPNGAFNNNVYGTDIYTSSSSICSAAVHAGIINTKNGGKVQIGIRPGKQFYNGVPRNGVVSSRADRNDWSFVFIK